jgi:uncharacterized protein
MIRLILSLALALSMHGLNAQPVTRALKIADEFVKNLFEKDYQEATAYFDSVMLKNLPKERLQLIWETINTQAGPVQAIEKVSTEEKGSVVTAIFLTKFEKMHLDIRVSITNSGKIGGLYFTPAHPVIAYQKPPYDDKASYNEKERELVIDAEHRLGGTFTLPDGIAQPKAVVIMVHGSGAHDRDETYGPNKPLKDLAIGLAGEGIASYRYDSRAKTHPHLIAAEGNAAGLEKTILEDVFRAIDLVKSEEMFRKSKVIVLGHSLGGMLAPMIATREKRVDGIIMLAANARPLTELVREQVRYLSNGQTPEGMEELMQQLERVEKGNFDLQTPASELPLGASAGFWKEIMAYDQQATASKWKKPILILQGHRDYQVTMRDFELWKKALARHKKATFLSYEKLNHFFHEGTGRSFPAEYLIENHIPEYVMRDIGEWVRGMK